MSTTNRTHAPLTDAERRRCQRLYFYQGLDYATIIRLTGYRYLDIKTAVDERLRQRASTPTGAPEGGAR